MAWSIFGGETGETPNTEAQATVNPPESFADKAKNAATGLFVNSLPGAGSIYSYDSEGLRLKPVAQIALGAMALYGVFKLVGGR